MADAGQQHQPDEQQVPPAHGALRPAGDLAPDRHVRFPVRPAEEPRRYLDADRGQDRLCGLRRGHLVAGEQQARSGQYHDVQLRIRPRRLQGLGRRDLQGLPLVARPHGEPLHLLHRRERFGAGQQLFVARKLDVPLGLHLDEHRRYGHAQAGGRPRPERGRRMEPRGLRLPHAEDLPPGQPLSLEAELHAHGRRVLLDHLGRLHVGAGRILRPRQLRLCRPLPGRSERPLRRVVEIPVQFAVGLLPLGIGRMAPLRRAVAQTARRRVAGQLQGSRQHRFARQCQHRPLPVPRDHDRFGQRLDRQVVGHHQRPERTLHVGAQPDPRRHHLGKGHHLQHRPRPRPVPQPAFVHRRLLPPQYDRPLHRRPEPPAGTR